MMFSVFIHPVFLFSYSTMSNYLDQKLTARCAGWVEQSLRLRSHLARICRAPCSNPVVWSVGLAPGHLLAALPGVGTAGQGSIGGFLSK